VEFIAYPDREMMMLALADRLAGDLVSALRTQERVCFSVPGGTTPGPVFDMLAAQDLDWGRVSVVLNDERWVDEDSPRSNTALIKKRLFVSKASAATLIPLYAPAPTPEDKIGALCDGLLPHLPISVLLLGMGEDMHTASLFPGADTLAAALADDAPPLMAMRADAAGEPRITLTAPVLRGALASHILITGAAKRAAIERAAGLSPQEAPIACVLGQSTVHWAE
jgi:6-phosphogluconolactonase